MGGGPHLLRGSAGRGRTLMDAAGIPKIRCGVPDVAGRPGGGEVPVVEAGGSVAPDRGGILRQPSPRAGGGRGRGGTHKTGAGDATGAHEIRHTSSSPPGSSGGHRSGAEHGRGVAGAGLRPRERVRGVGVGRASPDVRRAVPAGARPDVGVRRGGRAGAGGGAEGEAAAPVVAGGVPAARGVDMSGGGVVAAVQRDGSGHTSLRGHRGGVPGPPQAGRGAAARGVLGALSAQGVSAGVAEVGDGAGRAAERSPPRERNADAAVHDEYRRGRPQEGTGAAGRAAGGLGVGWLFRGLDGCPLGEYVREVGGDDVDLEIEASASPPHMMVDDVAGVWAMPSGVKRQVLDSFPVGLIDLGALRRLVPAKAGLFAMLDDIATFRAQLTGSGVTMPGPPSKLQDDMLKACVSGGVLRTERRAFPSVCGLSVFPLAKTNGKMRLIVDARPLNTAMHSPPKFSLPSPYELSELILRGGATHAVVADFKGFFWQFPLSAEVGQFFGVRQGARRMQLTRMAMGWSWAAVIAQETSLGLLGDMAGVCAAAWIDDNLILGKSAEQASARLRGFLRRADEVGAEVNRAKSTLTPVQVVVYAGIEWDLRARCRRLPGEWRRKARVVLDALLAASGPSLRDVWKGIGAVIWATYAMGDRFCSVPDMLAWIRARGAEVSAGAIDWDDQVQISAGMRSDLQVFVERRLVPDVWRVPRWKLSPEAGCDAVVWSDACPEGWGFIVRTWAGERAFRKWGTWSTVEDIFLLELRAMAWGVLHAVRGGARRILVVGDNAAVVAVLEKGHCAVRLGNTVLEGLFRVTDGAGAGMLSRWIATDRMPADELSRWGTAGQDWADPPSDGVVVDGGGFVWTDD